MKRLITLFFLLGCLAVGSLLIAEDGEGAAGKAAYVKTKNITTTGLQTLVPVGTAASPSISFAGDENTGIYSSTDQVLFSAGGIGRLAIQTGAIVPYQPILMNNGAGYAALPMAAGTKTVPCFTYVSNTTTGLGRNDIGQPSIIASSTEIQRWTNRQIYEPLIDVGGIFVSHTSIKGYKLTTDAAATRITVDGGADGAANRWAIASGTVYTGQVYVTGVATDSTRASVGYVIGFKASRVNNTVSVATCSTEILEDPSLTGCSADVLADSTNGAFYVSVIGSTTTNVRWGAVAKYMEVNQP